MQSLETEGTVVHDDAPRTVVGLGASCGGLNPLIRFLAALPPESSTAFVVVQQLSAEPRSLIPELLAMRAVMPIVSVKSAVRLAKDTVYLMPAQHTASLVSGELRPDALSPSQTQAPIDGFFGSLAEAYGSNAVGVLFLGTGPDGAEGAKRIRERGGTVFVQEAESGARGSAPTTLEGTSGLTQAITPEAIARELFRNRDSEESLLSSDELTAVLELLARSSGVDFSQYKLLMVMPRINRRLLQTGSSTLAGYLDYLALHPTEIVTLMQALMLGTTEFFRDPEMFESLESRLPALLRESDATNPLRIWCPGCSTGEEPYSIAMLLHEVREKYGFSTKFKLFASDIDGLAIEKASRGVFPASLREKLSPERIERFFEPSSEGFRVKRELRQDIVFTVHDALREPPFSRLDLLCCRNLLIYLRSDAQQNLFSRCMSALRTGGLLVLGAGESPTGICDGFEALDPRAKIYRRSAQRALRQVVSSKVSRVGGSSSRATSSESSEQRRLTEEMYRLLAEEHPSASFVLTARGRLVHSIGNVGEYIQLRGGATSLDVVKLAREGLGSVIGAGVSRALRTGLPAEYRGVGYRDFDQTRLIDVRVSPFSTDEHSRYLLVTLRPHPAYVPHGVGVSDPLIELQAELERTRQSLRSAMEEAELEKTELLMANEELSASNEGLQVANEALQASNEQFFTINAEYEQRIHDLVELNASGDNLLSATKLGLLHLDEALNLKRFTPQAASLLSLVERDIGRPVAHVTSPVQGVDLQAVARKVLQSGITCDVQADVAEQHLLLRIEPLLRAGVTRGVVIHFVDVTELRDAKDDLETVMNSLPEHVAVLDVHGGIRAVNDAWRHSTSANHVIGGTGEGVNYLQLTEQAAADGDGLADIALKGLRAVLDGSSDELRLEYPWSSGTEERAFLMQARPLPHRQGAVVSHVDITHRLRAERSIRDNEALFRKLFAFSREPLLLIDVDTLLVVEASTTTGELFERPASLLLGASIAELLVPEDCTWAELVDIIEGAGSGGAVVEFALPEPGSNGQCTLRTRLIPMQSGSRRCLLLAPNERTQTMPPSSSSPAELDQSQKMEALGKLAGGVAHELNNVLAAILSVAFAWRADLPANGEQARDVDAILAACRRGGDLTRSLLGFARRGNGIREDVDISAVVGDVISLVRATASPGITFKEELASEALWTMGDRSQIGQVLMNLCVNALDAMKTSGTLHIRVSAVHLSEALSSRRGSFVRLQVVDDGPGMDPATQQRAFEPFFTTKLRGEGTGLGLSMVYGVTRAHDGWTELESEPGHGTTATVFFPLIEHTSRNLPGPATMPVAAPGAQILVVDDDVLVRNALRRSMGRLGYEVFTACDGEDALVQIRTRGDTVEAVLLDLRMPGKDGVAVLAELRELYPELPVILSSGYTDYEGSPLFDLDELTDFLQKPVDPRVLIERIQRLVRIREGSQPSGHFVRPGVSKTDVEELIATS